MLSIGKLLTAEQRLSKALVAIMGSPKYTALAGVLMIGEKTVNDVPTACTNGRDEMYGREFVEGLTDAELRGLVLHENYHKLYQHMSTWKHLWNIDPHSANQAMDYVINIKIADDNTDGFAVIPKGGLLDAKYRGMDTAQVFNLIHQSETVTTVTVTVRWMSMIGRALKILATRRRERWRVTLTRPYVREH
jgi:predicted metal-dependent peptidase